MIKSYVRSIGAVLVGVLIFLGTLYFLFSTLKKPEIQNQKIKKIVSYPDPGRLRSYPGFLRGPGTVMNVKFFYEGDLIYDQIYKSDEYLFRVPIPLNENAEEHALFGGCSFTWGEGLKDNETLPWLFQKASEDSQAYNLGFPGGGLHTLLRYTEEFNLQNAVKKKDGKFFYVFMSNHLDRFFGRYNYLDLRPENAPYYEVINGEVIYRGEMKDQGFYQDFHQASRLKLKEALLRTQDPEKWSEDEFKSFVTAVKELRKRYLSTFPEGEFYFVFHPSGVSKEIRSKLASFLEKQKIPFLEPFEDYHSYLKENNFTHMDMAIRGDGHPSARLNIFFANWLAKKTESK